MEFAVFSSARIQNSVHRTSRRTHGYPKVSAWSYSVKLAAIWLKNLSPDTRLLYTEPSCSLRWFLPTKCQLNLRPDKNDKLIMQLLRSWDSQKRKKLSVNVSKKTGGSSAELLAVPHSSDSSCTFWWMDWYAPVSAPTATSGWKRFTR